MRATWIGLIGPVMWSTYPLLVLMVGVLPGLELASGVFCAASLLAIVVWCVFRISPLTLLKQRGAFSYIALGVAGFLGLNIFYVLALHTAPVAEAFLVLNSWQLIAMMLSLWMERKYPTRFHLSAIFLCISGVAILATGRGAEMGNLGRGHFEALLAALMWAGYSVLNRRYKHISIHTLGWVMIFSALSCIGLHALLEESVRPSLSQMLAVAALGFLPSGVGYYAWNYGAQHGDMKLLSILSYIGPMIAALLLVFFGYAAAQWHVVVAFILIVGGTLISVAGSFRVKGIREYENVRIREKSL